MGASQSYRIPGPNKTLYEGECNDDGKPHGHGSMRYQDQSVFTGRFEDGAPVEGKFVYKNGDEYQGELENNRPEGKGVWKDSKGIFAGNFIKGEFVNGTISYADGNYYSGYVVAGKKSGPNAEFKYRDGDRFVGEFQEDEFTQGVYESRDGSRYEGSFRNGQKHGEGKLVVKNKLIYQGTFVEDKFDGKGVLENLENKSTYEGEFYKGKKHGRGVYKDEKGNLYDGEFRENEKCGRGVLHFGQRKYEGMFDKGKFNGRGKLYYSNGDTYEGGFLNNKKHGQGLLKLVSLQEEYEGDFEEDKMTGKGRLRYSNGDVYVGEFLNNKKHGKGEYTRHSGEILRGEWSEDRKEGRFWEESNLGDVKSEGPYHNDERDGEFIVKNMGAETVEIWAAGKRISSSP